MGMVWRRCFLVAILFSVAAALSSGGRSSSGGPEFKTRLPALHEIEAQISSKGGEQRDPALVVTEDGFEVRWYKDGAGSGVFAQRFDLTGRRVGGVVRVGERSIPSVSRSAPLAHGRLMVWESYRGAEASWDVFAQRLDPAGEPFLLCVACAGAQSSPMVAVATGGDLLAVWESEGPESENWDIWARRIDSTGRPADDALRLNSITAGDQTTPFVAAVGDGFVVVWQGPDPETGLTSVFGKGTDGLIFADGFESGDASAWSAVFTGPVAVFTAMPISGSAPLEVTFDGSASSDLSSTITGWAWDFGDGNSDSGVMVSHTYQDAGQYLAVLTVTSADGGTGTAATAIGVDVPNLPPNAVFSATPTVGDVPLVVLFDASASSDPDGTITDWSWDFGDGNLGSGATVAHVYEQVGPVTATLTVTDDLDATAMAFQVIDAEPFNLAPTASFTATPSNGQVPIEVAFDASASSDDDGTIVSHAWDFGDGAAGNGATSSHLYTVPGVYEVVLTVTDDGGDTDLGVETVVVSEPQPAVPQVAPPPSPTLSTSISLSGMADPDVEIEVVGNAGTFQASADATGSFNAQVGLLTNRQNHLFVTAIDLEGRRSAPLVLRVVHDAMAPSLYIDFPRADAVLTNDTLTVSGRVGDLLSGFLGMEVLVEGEPANVVVGVGTNGTFDRTAVSLAPGVNTLSVTATDVLGNTVAKQVTVTRVAPTGARMIVVSGDAQNGPAGSLLAAPAVVRVLDAAGVPFAGKLVHFKVDLSDGALGETSAGGSSRSLQVRTDAEGEARVYWTLGSDAGCANNRLSVMSTDISGTIFFTASANPTAATQINVNSGNYQHAEVGTPAPEALRVWVNDGRNGVSGVEVTFTAHDGALVDGAASATVTSGVTGHAEVAYTLGPNTGAQLVEADFATISGLAAVFVLEGIARSPVIETSFSGRVIDNADRGIGGAACRLEVAGSVFETTSGEDGGFAFDDIPAGPAHLAVDGLSATSAGGVSVPADSFPALGFPLVVVPDATNTLPDAVRLPPLNPANARLYDGTSDVELTTAGLEGLSMTVRAGSMRRADGSSPSPADPALISLNPVHIDDLPMPIPDGAAPPFAWTFQPGGATFDPPVEILMPNMSGLPAGSAMFFLSFDHATERFEIVATGRVSDDGSEMVTDSGSGISIAGWGGFCPPYPNATNGDVQPPKVENVVDDCEGERGFLGTLLAGYRTVDTLCNNLPSLETDGAAYVEALQRCKRRSVKCAGKALQKTPGLPGTVSHVPIPGRVGLLTDLYGLFFAPDPPPPGEELERDPSVEKSRRGVLPPSAVTILEEENYLVTAELPGRYSRLLAELTDAAPEIEIGDVSEMADLREFGLGPRSFGTLEVLANDGLRVTVEAYVLDPDRLPSVVATIGNQSIAVPWPGAFTVPNIASPAGTLLRPRIHFAGIGAEYSIASPFFVEGVVNGSTEFDFPSTAAVDVPLVGIAIDPPTTILTDLGAALQLTVTAELADGTSREVTERQLGTVYTASNPEIVAVELDGMVSTLGSGIAFVTATNEGTSAVARVIVSPSDPLTTVEGFVQDASWAFLSGVSVTLTEQELSAQSGADGRFVFEDVATGVSESLTLTARAGSSQGLLFGGRSGIEPVPGGATDAGILILDALFDLPDGDGDGVANVLEGLLGTDPVDPDSDGDGISDGEEDADGDGLPDYAELLLGTDPLVPDSDGDGVLDGQEDFDGDGLTDGEELPLGTNPYHHDTDGDGFSDRDEQDDGSNPRDAASLPPSLAFAPVVVSVRNLAPPGLDTGRAFALPFSVRNLAPDPAR